MNFISSLQRRGRRISSEQEWLRNLSDALNEIPFLDGKRVETVDVAGASTVTITHRLGRKYQGYFILNSTYETAEDIANNNRPERQLVLTLGTSIQALTDEFKLILWIF